MSLDLFSSVDFYFSKFSIFSKLSFVFSLILLLSIFYNNSSFKKKKSVFNLMMSNIKQNLSKSVKFNMMSSLFLISMFFFILTSNISGLFPFVFGWTAHIMIILVLSLFIWLSMNLSQASFNLMKYTSHFTPQGVPLLLGLFLAKIELISKVIRPLTLSLRLGINMTTGHVLLALMSVISILKTFVILMVIGYFLFELFVMFIQAIVYTLLLSQYMD